MRYSILEDVKYKMLFQRIRDLCIEYLDNFETKDAKAFAEAIERLIEVSGVKETKND